MRIPKARSFGAAGWFALLTLILCANPGLQAENWPHWRGPTFHGSSPEKGLPTTFSPERNVRWSQTLPGPSAATPIIWEKRVFISTVDPSQDSLLALCLDADSGEILWSQPTGKGISRDRRSNFAAPSPVTDGHHVWFFYSSGELIAFTLGGQKVWERNIQKDYGEFTFQWTFSSSPTVYGNRLYLQVLQRNEPVRGGSANTGPFKSYILALDPTTGKELWRQLRPAKAQKESLEAFTTPIPFTHGQRSELLIAGGDCLTGHDLVTGQELWRWGTWNPTRIPHWRLVPSPVGGEGIILACAPKGDPIYAVAAGAKGQLAQHDTAWVSSDRAVSSDVPTPLLYQGRFYVLNGDRKILSCVRPRTGEVIWTQELDCRRKFEASPTGADGKIYLISHGAETFVLQAGDTAKILHQTNMGEGSFDHPVRSTIAVADGRLYLRAGAKLYCLEAE